MREKTENKEIISKIEILKKGLGKELVILAHHYQRKEIVDLADYKGDSFGLSRKAAADKDARHIVFCGVHFMAESAEILSQEHQIVQIPDEEAGCWMADMADIVMVERAWEELTSITGDEAVMPVVYMNSDAELKAFCGRNGGIVCTSSNARAAMEWGFNERERILFFPDQHLGRNTGNLMGIPSEQMIVWNPDMPLGGNSPDDIKNAKVILWDGYCLVHSRFKTDHMLKMRAEYPNAKIVVHPECTEDVVALADATGSTGFIVKYVDNSPPGSTVIIGTEINLINRLAFEYPDRTVLPLHQFLCPNMYRITPEKLLWTLENIGAVNVVKVPEELKKDAVKALDRMLALA
jgi:quinolinate synthase